MGLLKIDDSPTKRILGCPPTGPIPKRPQTSGKWTGRGFGRPHGQKRLADGRTAFAQRRRSPRRPRRRPPRRRPSRCRHWHRRPGRAAQGPGPCGCGSKPMGSHFGVFGAPPILEPILEGDWDVHWGYDLDFDPWPCESAC